MLRLLAFVLFTLPFFASTLVSADAPSKIYGVNLGTLLDDNATSDFVDVRAFHRLVACN